MHNGYGERNMSLDKPSNTTKKFQLPHCVNGKKQTIV